MVSRRGVPGEDAGGQTRRQRSRSRRRRETTGQAIGPGGRRLGEGDQDDDVSDGEEKDAKRGELPAYGGVDPSLPIYVDALALDRTDRMPEDGDIAAASPSAVPVSTTAEAIALARRNTAPRPPPRRSSTRSGVRTAARDRSTGGSSLDSTPERSYASSVAGEAVAREDGNDAGSAHERDGPGPFIPRQSSLNHLITLGSVSRHNSLRRPRPSSPTASELGEADSEEGVRGRRASRGHGHDESPIMGGFAGAEAALPAETPPYEDVAAYEASTRVSR